MTIQNQDERGAAQLDGALETLVASTELMGFDPTSRQIAAAGAFLEAFPTTTAALVALRAALANLEAEIGDPVLCTGDALLAAIPAIAAVEAGCM